MKPADHPPTRARILVEEPPPFKTARELLAVRETPELRFCVTGAPRQKKNSPQMRSATSKRGTTYKKPIPSAAWLSWCHDAMFILPNGQLVMQPPVWNHGPCSIAAAFYLDKDNGADAANLYNGLADLLQTRHCFPDDNVLKDWDGSRVYVDSINPRVEVVMRHAR